jgi:cytochrome c peroxidase
MRAKVKIFLLLTGVAFLSFKSITGPELFSVPTNFPKPTYHFDSNPLSIAGVELGKTLFYDAIISSDNTVSCGSCHQQSAGFTQHGHVLSHGVNDKLTKRNSMPLFNLAWSDSFGWDGGVHDLDFFAISPITNPVEMNESLGNVLEKLRQSPQYPALFKSAFGTEEINTERFLKALSQFMLTMVSANSRYDHYIRYEGVELNKAELEGLELFKKKCASCHSGELFTDFSFRNNGLPRLDEKDFGQFEVNQNENDKFKFKVPSLRNLTYTTPYMHDGRFSTLEEVLNHYASQVENTPFLDPKLREEGRLGIALTREEQQKIILFLKTLDDEDFIKNPFFSEGSLANAIPQKNIDEELMSFQMTDKLQRALFSQCTESYLKIKAAIQASNSKGAGKEARTLFKILSKISIAQESQRAFFKKYQDKLLFDVEHIIEGEHSVEHQLDHFKDLSDHLYILLASFNAQHKTLYFNQCLESKMDWLSDKSADTFIAKNCKERQTRTLHQ